MNKRIVLVIVLALSALNVAESQTAKVRGTLSGMQAGQQLQLNYVEGNRVLPCDTLTLDAKGTLAFEVKTERPTLYLLSPMKINQAPMLHLMLAPKDNVQLTVAYDPQLNFLSIESCKGSRNVQLYQAFNQLLYNTAKQSRAIDDEYLRPSTTETRKQELAAQAQALQLAQSQGVEKLIAQNSDVLMSAFLVTYFEQDFESHYELFEAVYNANSKQYPNDQFVRYLDSKLKSSLGPGRMAPDIVMRDPEGKERKLSDLRGKVVLIDFWASWCRPCRMENPNVVRLYHRYHDKGFDIFSVSLDKRRDDWVHAIASDGLVWENHVSDLKGWTSSGGATYGITSVPSTVLVGPDGKIIARNLRGAELERKLEELFGQ